MAALMREFPQMKLTFNLVPSLLVQLEAFAEGRARDWHLELGLKPADALTQHERATILSEFFHAPRGRMIDRYPRYAELLQKRDSGGGYADQDFLDLQVWHKLAWVDPFYLDNDERVRRLVHKQRGFSEADKAELRECGARDTRARDSGVPRGRRARAGRALDLAVLSPDSSALVRYRHLSQDPSGRERAATGVSSSGRRRRTAHASPPVSSAAVRARARRTVAIGRVGVR